MKNHFLRKIITDRKFFIFIIVASIFIAISVTAIITHTIVKSNLEARTTLLEARLEQERMMKAQALDNLQDVITIRNAYRDNLRGIIQLIYNRDTHLSVGGVDIEVEDSDEAILLQMRTIISSMNDDLQLMSQVGEYLRMRNEFIDSFPFIWPVRGGVPEVSSPYGYRNNPFTVEGPMTYHPGIDIPGGPEDEIIATASGRVIQIWTDESSLGEHPLYGRFVMIQHDYGFTTYYGHLGEIYVRWGQEIEKGETIALMGNTGRSLGYHLHYEVRNNNIAMDPMNYLLTNW